MSAQNQSHGSRVILILVLLYAGLFGVPGLADGIFAFRPFSKDEPTISLNLKPGIDIAGGTSLVYKIQKPEGYFDTGQGTLAEQVAAVLKKRVDPLGTKNLIWRPQGDDRLEIQLPRVTGGKSGDQAAAAKAKADYNALLRDLKNFNVTFEQVRYAVEELKGDARAKELEKLAGGSDQRKALFAQLTSLYDKRQGSQAALDAARAAGKKDTDPEVAKLIQDVGEARAEYTRAKGRVEEANINVTQIESLLGQSDPVSTATLDGISANLPAPARETLARLRKVYPEFVRSKDLIGDTGELKRMLRGSGVLQFHILVDDPERQQPEMVRRFDTEGAVVKANDESRWFLVARPEDFRGGKARISPRDNQAYVLAWVTPDPATGAPRSLVHKEGEKDWALQRAYETHDSQSGAAVVGFEFDAVGGVLFGKLTGANVGKGLATVLDNKVITAPNINSRIDKSGIITLGAKENTAAERLYLINTFNAGSLPATLAEEPISEREIAPSLGASNLRAGLWSCVGGLAVIGVFMIFYYRLSGLIAVIALLFNMVLILGVLAMMGATFTLPGIAGLILTIGVSVDANVLIFERLREEQMRGLSLKMALRNAYDRAFTAILDSNVTTAITSAFLVYFGSEEVKGFGLTLLIGILTSMFTALYLTGALFDVLQDKFGLRKLGSFPLYNPWWNRLLVPKVAWMNHWKKFLLFSVVFAGLGLTGFILNRDRMLDVEFAGGTEVQFATKTPMTDGDVYKRIAAADRDVPQPTVTAMGRAEDGKYREFSIVTSNQDRTQVATALFKVLEDQLTIAVPSTFAVGDQTSELRNRLSVETAQQAGVVVPVTTKDGRFTALNRDVPGAAAYSNGVAVIMDKISPPLAPEEIRQRIGRALAEANDSNLTQFDVVRLDGQTGEDRPTDRAVAMLVSRNFPYDKNAAEWVEKVARPFWKATTAGVGREASFQKVTNVDAQVAGATQQAAIFATLGSMVGVMIWIWLRFGDFKYGTATVAAMLHDTVLVVGAVGLSHWIGGTVVGDVLGIEGFRVNLTLVAAILTVMGYSMVDTIVVFDRIRENRGKYGVISKKLIDDSVNQTLSRTLLTVATTCATLLVMFIWGGAAIHGFAYVLLVGILIGTYSSIAIAAPILLIGHDEPKVRVEATRAGEPPKKAQRVNA